MQPYHVYVSITVIDCLLCVCYIGKSGWAQSADCIHPGDTCDAVLWRERIVWETDRLWAQQQHPSVYVWNAIHQEW